MVSRYEYGRPDLPALPSYQKERRAGRPRGRALPPPPGKSGESSGRALRRKVKTALCGILFLTIFGLRLLSPALGEKIDGQLLRLIDGGWNYKEAIAAVGSFAAQDGLAAVSALFRQEPEPLRLDEGPAAGAARQTLRESLYARAGTGGQPETAPEEAPAETPTVPAEPDTAQEGGGPEAETGGDAAPQPSPETAEQPDVVTQFLESQSAFAEQGIPEDVSVERPELGIACVAPALGRVTDGFGWRVHPLSGEVKFHYGTDIGATEGSAVGAFADGTVYATGDSATLGLYVMVDHPGGLQTLYAHCREVLVSAGETVQAGQSIALVGATGAVTGPHLHLELKQNGVYLNPAYYLDFSAESL